MASKEIINDIKINNGINQLVRTTQNGNLPAVLLNGTSSVSSWEFPETAIVYSANAQNLTGGSEVVNRGVNQFDIDGILTINQSGFYLINVSTSFNIFSADDIIDYTVSFTINGIPNIANVVRNLNGLIANTYHNTIYLQLEENDELTFDFILNKVSGTGTQTNKITKFNIAFLG